MEHLLISEAKHVRFANERGIQKISRNIMALQQGLKAIDVISESDADFQRARAYYALFSLTPSVSKRVSRVPLIFIIHRIENA